ncbi:family 16 glycoside hydrolase [Pseudozobellia thermophila]|uniref:PA14 domain-containing protein n=1 Tax=Pseudozobellia thermophila TaxID=192903 RepID=A0A1M6GBJ9_9FLAO|nr:family 16 glycoside hydrolase [Pseudozobellia thermophila]SHJ07277.1 PA14 domain-containing protein [Pseudozobellia thermophila]
MKNSIPIIALVFLFLSCKDVKETESAEISPEPDVLPFTEVSLHDLSAFRATSSNWKVVRGVFVDRSKDKAIESTEGSGVLLNIPTETEKGHLLTDFEHGDIELEVDVMMPKGSNSGLYFQGRYEVQLFDSWETSEPTYGDMGGIYQRDNGEEGYPPKLNAAKAPGLWQRLKIVFHAPRFDASGKKTKNAQFREVWLNGELIHKDQEVSAPTRSSMANDEVAKAPLMIQGDHGPVALKNLKYKLYGPDKIALSKISVGEYDYRGVKIPDLDTLQPIRKFETDSISSALITENRVSRLLDFNGILEVPVSGTYLFDTRINSGGSLLIIGNDTIIDQDGKYELDEPKTGMVELEKGELPFRFVYNKHNQWRQGFTLSYEGPNMERRPLSSPGSLLEKKESEANKILVEVGDKVVMQRGFLMHNGSKRTHCISVGSPDKVHFAYDLAAGSVLAGWSGDFFDATEMWLGRGIEQLGKPLGFTVWFSGGPQFAHLESKESPWPVHDYGASPQDYDGYEIDGEGFPVFLRNVSGVHIKDKLLPLDQERGLKRKIEIEGNKEIWHKLAVGDSVVKLPDGSYRIDGANYFMAIATEGTPPEIRSNGYKEELLVRLPSGAQGLEYNIIW